MGREFILLAQLSMLFLSVDNASAQTSVTSTMQQSALTAYVEDASQRFALPAKWIWAVMQQESAGKRLALSPKGAMGLMQLMPQTWRLMQQQHNLGADPYDAKDNILAGAAYLREMHDRFGTDGFLAAYNAGPGRFDAHLKTGRPLPDETRKYVAKISQRLDFSTSIKPRERHDIPHDDDDGELFVASSTDAFSFKNAAALKSSERIFNSHHIADLTALTARTDGMFITLSSR